MLSATAQAQHWSLAWTGLDAAEALAALATAVLLAHGEGRAALTGAVGGTLLLTDAWFDVCTSAPGLDHALAMAEAAFVEVPWPSQRAGWHSGSPRLPTSNGLPNPWLASVRKWRRNNCFRRLTQLSGTVHGRSGAGRPQWPEAFRSAAIQPLSSQRGARVRAEGLTHSARR